MRARERMQASVGERASEGERERVRESKPARASDSLGELALGGLRQVPGQRVVPGADGGVGAGQPPEQRVVHHHEGRGRGVVALVVEVGRGLREAVAMATEGRAHHTAFVEGPALFGGLGQDVVREVWRGNVREEGVVDN